MTRQMILKQIPNLLSMLNLLLGVLAIIILIQMEHPQKVKFVCLCILVGAVADFFDGFLARRLGAISEMGKQLDSFADLITFGIAPIGLMNYVYAHRNNGLLLAVSVIYVGSGVFRLARYNVGDYRDHFQGLPITAAGIILTGFAFVYDRWSSLSQGGFFPGVIMLLVMSVLAILMVSKFRVNRVKI